MVSWQLQCWNTRLKQAPSNVRASYSAMHGWLREYAETLTGPLGLLRTKHNLLDRCRWTSIRLAQCRASRLARTGKGSRRERARARVARARIRSRYPNLSNSKDTAGIARSGDTSVPTAGNASPTASRRVVRQQPLLTMMETLQP